MTEAKGLYGKYLIAKANGMPIEPKADYFILRLDTDKAARIAALVYAELIDEINHSLALDLRNRIAKHSAHVKKQADEEAEENERHNNYDGR